MEKNKAGIVLGAGILIALLVSIFAYSSLQKKSKMQVQPAETGPAVVATIDLPWGTVLSQGGGVGAIITPKKRAMAVKVDKVVGQGKRIWKLANY
jgi:Flp pilus assembly protein CpaB